MSASPRQIVVDALTELGYPIVQSRLPGNIARPTLVVALGRIDAGPVQHALKWGVLVYVLTPHSDESAEDDLEQVVQDVVVALTVHQPMRLADGERQTVADDAYNAFALNVEVLTGRTTP